MKELKEKILDELFKDKEKIELIRGNFWDVSLKQGKKMEKIRAKFQKKREDITRGQNFEPKDVQKVADCLIMEIGSHLVFADFIECVYQKYKNRPKGSKYSPAYRTQKKVDKYNVELCKLLHSLTVKLRFAMFFGFGEVESSVGVVSLKKLPTAEEAKKMSKERRKKLWKSAVDSVGKVDVKTINILKEEKKK